ncbi:hypothetical protein ACH5RR_023541 [Cinchona calisaya]|uniref:Uncharacterized protein n=1 Tax=Cinchona calisaya TaxID=153742 RepID=A0ABD2ZCH0_9GENT
MDHDAGDLFTAEVKPQMDQTLKEDGILLGQVLESAKGTFHLCRRLHWEFSKSHASYSPLVAFFTIDSIGQRTSYSCHSTSSSLKGSCLRIKQRIREHKSHSVYADSHSTTIIPLLGGTKKSRTSVPTKQ